MTDNLTLDDIATAIKATDKVRHTVAQDPSRRNNDWLKNIDHTIAVLLILEAEATPDPAPPAHEVIDTVRRECNATGYAEALLWAAQMYAHRFPEKFDGADWSDPARVFHTAADKIHYKGNEVDYHQLTAAAWIAQNNPSAFRRAAGVDEPAPAPAPEPAPEPTATEVLHDAFMQADLGSTHESILETAKRYAEAHPEWFALWHTFDGPSSALLRASTEAGEAGDVTAEHLLTAAACVADDHPALFGGAA